MAKYLIHAIPKRLWYVNDYLIPSMVKQGINNNDITVYVDTEKLGNLKACMEAFKSVENNNEGTWHLQDDIIISRKFKETTEQYNTGIVCGFCSRYDDSRPYGNVSVHDMWFSFPCIRIPNNIAIDCANWVLRYMIGNPVYKEYWRRGVNDDFIFRLFIESFYKEETAVNLNPNIVNHIDYLIGGTSSGINRDEQAVSRLWEDDFLIEELKQELQCISQEIKQVQDF